MSDLSPCSACKGLFDSDNLYGHPYHVGYRCLSCLELDTLRLNHEHLRKRLALAEASIKELVDAIDSRGPGNKQQLTAFRNGRALLAAWRAGGEGK